MKSVKPVTPELFKKLMGSFVTGVSVVTTQVDGVLHGLTVSALSSVSLDPPLLLVCIDHHARAYEHLRRAPAFSINFLAEDQSTVAEKFAEPGLSMEERLSSVEYFLGKTGCPLFRHSLAVMECRIAGTYTAGDHDIFLGEILSGEVDPQPKPLLYFRGSFGLE